MGYPKEKLKDLVPCEVQPYVRIECGKNAKELGIDTSKMFIDTSDDKIYKLQGK